MVGTNDEWETEGFDRTTMDLPGRQDELVRRVCAANPRTAVIVNAGSPVTMDWADRRPTRAPAVLTSFFAGQEQAEALVDVLLGVADPGGRLPLTIPTRLEDHPARENEGTTEGTYGKPVQRYEEGLNVGYRGYEHRGVAPRFAFGHGLSYGDAEWGAPVGRPHRRVRRRSGRHGHRADHGPRRPLRHRRRAGLRRSRSTEGASDRRRNCARSPRSSSSRAPTRDVATLTFDDRAFARWDTAGAEWVVDRGDYDLVIAASAADERSRVRITIS